MMAAAHAATQFCRPFRADRKGDLRVLGLTPQAMNMPPLRGFAHWGFAVTGRGSHNVLTFYRSNV